MNQEKELAKLIHVKLCRSNRQDQCGWYYHEEDWTAFPQKEYLTKANNILAITDFETAKNVFGQL